ncbi:glycosyltransferase family 2 protein [Haloarchaeobius sp. DFWS5]|uniref:glycosyltransferase family 2 protein n=1 Tax=Haloarchaeobius sp. DFWS5 TaxID=3446114 RepID=UPI003EB8F757
MDQVSRNPGRTNVTSSLGSSGTSKGDASNTAREVPNVIVAVPAYNEGESIASVVTEAKEYAHTVLVVDDGSSDQTAVRAVEAGAVTVRHEENSGYGAALKTAFSKAADWNADHLVVIDGDGQHDPTDIQKLVDTQQSHDAEIIIGSRFKGQSEIPRYRRIGLGVVNFLIWFSFLLLNSSSRVRDTQSGFRAYNKSAIQSLATDENLTDGMGASVDVLFHACSRGFNVREVETTITYDGPNTSTHNPIRHGYVLVKRVARAFLDTREINSTSQRKTRNS